MTEAALLALELFFIVALLWAVNSASKPGASKSLGIFDYKNIRTDADVISPIKVKKNA